MEQLQHTELIVEDIVAILCKDKDMGGYPDVGLQGRWRDGGETSATEENVLYCNVQNQIGNVSN